MNREGTTLIFKLNSPYDITDEPNFKIVDYSSSSLRDNLPQPEALTNTPECSVVEPGNEIVEPTSDKVFQLQLGSYYSVQTTSEGDISSQIARLDSHNDNGGWFTLLKHVRSSGGSDMYRVDSSVVSISIENILCDLPEPNHIRSSSLLFWD